MRDKQTKEQKQKPKVFETTFQGLALDQLQSKNSLGAISRLALNVSSPFTLETIQRDLIQ